MQIFIPYANPKKTAKVLDNRRLNKQILECIQILSANTSIDVGWKIPKYIYNHPNTLLWRSNANDLKNTRYLLWYTDCLLLEYSIRTKKIHKAYKKINLLYKILFIGRYSFLYNKCNPYFLTPEFCKQHQQLLLQKDYEHYSKYF